MFSELESVDADAQKDDDGEETSLSNEELNMK